MATQGFESYSGVGRRGGAMEVVTAERGVTARLLEVSGVLTEEGQD